MNLNWNSDSDESSSARSFCHNSEFNEYNEYSENLNYDRHDGKIESAFKEFDRISRHDICILLENHSRMAEDFIHILSNDHKINLWPSNLPFNIDHAKQPNYVQIYYECYMKSVKKKIKSSKLVIAFVTNKFSKTNKLIELIEYANKFKKQSIALIVDNIDNYCEIKQTISKNFCYYCEIFKARVNLIGFDHFLWTSRYFEYLRQAIERLLKKKFVSIYFLLLFVCFYTLTFLSV